LLVAQKKIKEARSIVSFNFSWLVVGLFIVILNLFVSFVRSDFFAPFSFSFAEGANNPLARGASKISSLLAVDRLCGFRMAKEAAEVVLMKSLIASQSWVFSPSPARASPDFSFSLSLSLFHALCLFLSNRHAHNNRELALFATGKLPENHLENQMQLEV